MDDRRLYILLRQKLKKGTLPWIICKYSYRAACEIIKPISDKYCKDWLVRNVQIDITYRCNKLCRRCNRYCNFKKLPYLKETDMTIDQIEKFIDQVKQKGIYLNCIQLLGGEPFLHPQLNNFISILFYKLMVPGNVLLMEIWTNGLIDPDCILKSCRSDSVINKAFNQGKIRVVVSPKDKEKSFFHVLSAPVDLGFNWNICSYPRDCGVLLNIYGYWPGNICSAIALLFGLSKYAKYDFPVKFRENWPDLREDICKYCIAGCKELAGTKPRQVTKSYREAILKQMRGAPLVPGKF